jgi:hypothetical protein
MRSRKRELADDQIEAKVLSKRNDASAWEALEPVSASTSQRPAWMLSKQEPLARQSDAPATRVRAKARETE